MCRVIMGISDMNVWLMGLLTYLPSSPDSQSRTLEGLGGFGFRV